MATKPPETEMHTQQLNFQTWFLKVSIHCQGCKTKVKRVLQAIEGVYTTDIDSMQHKVTVTGNIDAETLIKKLARSGKHAQLWPEQKPLTPDNNKSPKPDKDENHAAEKLSSTNEADYLKLGPNNQLQADSSGGKKKKKKKKNKNGNSGNVGGGSSGGAAAEAIKESPQNQDSIQYNAAYSSGSASWSVPSIQDHVYYHQPQLPPSDHMYKISYNYDHHDYGYDEDDVGCSVM